MPTIKEKLYFNYNGKSCRDFGLVHVSLDSGMYEETLSASRTINETTVRGSDTPLFHSIDEDTLEFPLTIAFEKDFDEKTINDVVLWLFQDYYKPLYFEGLEDRVYYCMPNGDSSLMHNGLSQGYVTLTMKCNSSKISSGMKQTEKYVVEGSKTIALKNNGHVEVFPEISIKKIGAGSVTIERDGDIFEVRELTNAEDIYVNTEKEIIETDIIGMYRYDNVIGEYYNASLKVGSNNIKITGNCEVIFRYFEKYRF